MSQLVRRLRRLPQGSSIYPLRNVYIREVKILKAPKFNIGKLMEVPNPMHHCLSKVHGDCLEDVGVKLDRSADETIAERETTVVVDA